MPNAGLALLVALAIWPSVPDDAPLAATRLERRMAERGPIRARLETARADIAVDALEASLVQERRAASQAPASSSWAWAVAAVFALVFVLAAWVSSLDSVF
jgi:hypothetical protein